MRIFQEGAVPKSEHEASSEIAKTVSLTEKDVRDAARLLRLLADPTLAENAGTGFFRPGPVTADREIRRSRARAILNSRRLRDRFFSRDLFGEPAWDILLLLYASDQSAGRLTMTRLAEWIEVPLTTVGRWVKILEEERLVERQAHPTDRRTVFINLLEKARTALDTYLARLSD